MNIPHVSTSSVYVPKSQIDETFAAPVEQGKKDLEPFKSFAKETGLPFLLLRDHAVSNNKVEIHLDWDDLWLCLDGEVTFQIDGELVDPFYSKRADGTPNEREIRALEMKGGKTVVLKSGDWLWIPAGQGHVHAASGTASLAIVKLPPRG